MKSDEGFLNNVDKQMLNQLVNENVIPFTKQNSKRAVFTALFLCLSHKSSMNSENKNNYLNKKYESVVTIKTIMTQIERLVRNCFSLEFDCKKLGNTNISTPII